MRPSVAASADHLESHHSGELKARLAAIVENSDDASENTETIPQSASSSPA